MIIKGEEMTLTDLTRAAKRAGVTPGEMYLHYFPRIGESVTVIEGVEDERLAG